ncbi:class I SAM-dependent methyltransferase [Hyphobacterium sp.]|uniref:class I SAM-dependent methyltransferase n=1 Tax=Hyphobacterium sp. TaxID=2004662 RepID=UPI003BA97301
MSNSAGFWDRIADKYAARPVDNEEAYQRKLEMTRALFNPEMDIVEFGCGTGTTALYHAPHVNQVLASDISERMIEIAWSKAQAQGIENVMFEVDDIDSHKPQKNRFGVVMMHSLLHLLKDRRAAIRKAYEMTAPGGYYVTSTVCISGIKRALAVMIFAMRLFGKAPMVKFFSSKVLVEDMKAAGFAIDTVWQPEGGLAVFIIAKKPVS